VDSVHRPGPPWTGGHCRVLELIGARPPALWWLRLLDEGRRRERGARGSRFQVHWGSEGGGAMGVGGEGSGGGAPVRITRGSEMVQGGAGEEGMSGCPFIGSEGERGGWASEGNGWCRWCTIMVVEAAVSGGDRPGWSWGVMRGGAPAVTGAEGASGGGGGRRFGEKDDWAGPACL
jgi:hypothetical protein